jgi:dTDP-4-amino-4,6-dideoxygalactose transaminase
MILFRNRASTVLYDVLITLDKNIKFLLPLNICPIVPDTFIRAGIKFEFVDIDMNTLCMDKKLALEAIKNDKSISGILFVKMYGTELNTEDFYQELKTFNQNFFVIDDQCLSIPKLDFDINNSFASLTLFSSGYSKYVDIGYGGFGFLKDSEFKERLQDNKNSKLFLDYQIEIKEKIPLIRDHKSKLNAIYQKGIPSNMHLGKAFESWRFSILINNKNDLLKVIFQEKGLFASSHYNPIDYKYTDNPIQNSNTYKISSKIVNLFNDFRFTEEKATDIVKIINNFVR